ncbi:MAG: hypothetical protein ABFD97_11755 [Syntrophobacter sp.]
MGERIIDLDKEFLDSFKKEEMFAFFDITLRLPEERTASGLCKVSKPKSSDSHSYYISLLFLIDDADGTLCQALDGHINRINWDDLNTCVPEIVSVLPMPYLSKRSGIYIREIAIYLTTDKLTRPFVAQLGPLLARTAGIKAEKPTFWDDMPRDE